MCDDAITNPVCPACLHKGVRQWLLEQRELRLAAEVLDATVQDIVAGSTNCIKCRSPMAVCAYCYTKDIFDVIKRRPALVDNYLIYFNFDLEHLGWEQTARDIAEENY
jgi:hypothetical protein